MTGIILVAALARPFEDAIVEQMTYISSLTDSSARAKEQIAEIKKQADNIKKLGTPDFDDKLPLLLNVPRPYWEFANAYKPVEVVSKLTLPMLILQGERDYQVTMQDFGVLDFCVIRMLSLNLTLNLIICCRKVVVRLLHLNITRHHL